MSNEVAHAVIVLIEILQPTLQVLLAPGRLRDDFFALENHAVCLVGRQVIFFHVGQKCFFFLLFFFRQGLNGFDKAA